MESERAIFITEHNMYSHSKIHRHAHSEMLNKCLNRVFNLECQRASTFSRLLVQNKNHNPKGSPSTKTNSGHIVVKELGDRQLLLKLIVDIKTDIHY